MALVDHLFAVIPMLGVLIFVHEFGHFLVAKAVGVRVLKFSIGFGAPIGFGLFIASPRRVIFNFLGYDTDPAAEAKEIGVFPMIIYRGFERSLESGRNLFLSTGAASFKLIRGTVESLEYEGVSTRHLPIHRRLPWRLVAALFRLGSQNLNSSEI